MGINRRMNLFSSFFRQCFTWTQKFLSKKLLFIWHTPVRYLWNCFAIHFLKAEESLPLRVEEEIYWIYFWLKIALSFIYQWKIWNQYFVGLSPQNHSLSELIHKNIVKEEREGRLSSSHILFKRNKNFFFGYKRRKSLYKF